MLNGVGNENGKKTNKPTTTTLHVQHTFSYIYLPLLLVSLFAFFSSAAHFQLAGRYWLAFLIFSPPV